MDKKPINECFSIVPEHIENNGGKQIIGWYIHVWEKVLIEAEFYYVWQTPDGELVDIAPQKYTIENIIFLPDSKMQYSGRQVDNIRKPISKDNQVVAYIELAKKYFCYINEGDLADFYGIVEIREGFSEQVERLKELEINLIRKYGNFREVSINSKFIR